MADYPSTAVPSDYERLMMARMGTGFSRRTWRQLKRSGSARRWFRDQLHPELIEESPRAAALPTWFPDLEHAAAEQVANNDSGVKPAWKYARDLAAITILRRAYSNRPVLEMMTEFWSNHLHIPTTGDLPSWAWRSSYDTLLRTHALGTFEDLLREATLHPAMLLYLDNFRSRRTAPNENHGRELLELHTVGRDGGYTEAMVKDAAKILSGWSVRAWQIWEPFYDLGNHATGAVSVLGFEHPNTEADGQAVTVAFLKHLAHHPATALTLARRLAVKFVSDDPSQALVEQLADVYLSNGTAIVPVLNALVASDEFTAMEAVEDADPTSSVRRGWVNRLIGLDNAANPLEAVHLGSVMEPTLLAGPAPTVAAFELKKIALVGAEPTSGEWGKRRTAPGPLGAAGRSTLETVAKVAPLAGIAYQPAEGVTYPSSSLGTSLAGTAQLIKADLGTEVVSIDYGSCGTTTPTTAPSRTATCGPRCAASRPLSTRSCVTSAPCGRRSPS